MRLGVSMAPGEDDEPELQVFTEDDIREYFAAGNHPDVRIGPKEERG